MASDLLQGGAVYHLGYELKGEQPVISVHTDPANLESLQGLGDKLERVQAYLGMASSFAFESDAFGYEGVGTIGESTHVVGWAALQLALPEPKTDSRYRGSPTPQVLPIATTLSVVLEHAVQSATGKTDPKNPQLVVASLANRTPLNSQYSAPLRAIITPPALERLSAVTDLGAAEEQVRQALFASFQYPYRHVDDYDFRVTLDDEIISFDYPGDGTGFFARRSRDTTKDGLMVNAANNDYPIQQMSLIGGLAALNDVVLGRTKA